MKEKNIGSQQFRINGRVRSPEIRLIDGDGENRGVVTLREAMDIAAEAGLDLVEVSPGAKPPVCRVMDFGKFQYQRAKKDKEARKQQTKIELKEIRLRPKTNDHHRGFKVKDAKRWLTEGKKVKVTIRFRGREMDYPEIGRKLLDTIEEELTEVSITEQKPKMEGRRMMLVLAPNK
ncbi:MAG: translation initiation factor IF-3 [Anaerolineae bacterium]|nr:translation initiation factor IF-3 [Anaerolineae bacterium]MBT7075820.1 translation initiation factor IF-3 [Anaerolineae bacterium]MBT7783332.1 translation initiation factor IF-3 [Anaerolineae bacterium]